MSQWGDKLHFLPPLGFGWTLLVIAVAVLSVIWFDWMHHDKTTGPRWLPWVWLRLGALGTLAWVLAGPSVQDGSEDTEASTPVVFLVDRSASMDQRDMVNPGTAVKPSDPVDHHMTTRWNAIVQNWLHPEFISRLRKDHADVRLYGFDSRLRAMGFDEARQLDEPVGDSTNLFGAIDQVLSQARQEEAGDQPSHAGLVVVLSDGHDSRYGTDPEMLARLRQARWPVMTVPVGAAGTVADLAVAAWAEADFLFENQATWIQAVVTQTGFGHRRVRVDLFHEDRLVESQELAFGQKPTVRARFRVTPSLEPGQPVTLHAYRVVTRLASQPASLESTRDSDTESFMENNRRWVFVQVSSDRIKVALLEARPYWDTKFLARVLENDPQVDLTAVYRVGSDRSMIRRSDPSAGGRQPPEPMNVVPDGPSLIGLGTGGSPTQAWLNRFDVVILGKGAHNFFGPDHAHMLVDYVLDRGGALVLARGRAFDDTTASSRRSGQILSDIEPIRWGNTVVRHLKLKLAPAGRTSPLTRFEHLASTDVILTQLPDMLAATQIESEKAATIVLLHQAAVADGSRRTSQDAPQGSAMAAVAYQNAGRGRVFAVLGDGLWRWAFLPSSQRQYDSVYELFWTRAIRWLATGGAFLPGQSVSISQSKLAAKPGESVTVTVTARHIQLQDFHPQLMVTAPDGQTQAIALAPASGHRYLATVEPTMPGVYQLQLQDSGPARANQIGPVTSRLAVYDPSTERLDTSARPELLALISQATGGACLNSEQPEQLLEFLQDLRLARESGLRDRYVFDRPVVFTLIAGLFGLEWFLRRRSGLL